MAVIAATGIRWRMDFLEQIGLTIQRLRRLKALSQEKLAHDAEIDQAYLSRIEAGKSDIGLRMLLKISQALSVHPAEIIKDIKIGATAIRDDPSSS